MHLLQLYRSKQALPWYSQIVRLFNVVYLSNDERHLEVYSTSLHMKFLIDLQNSLARKWTITFEVGSFATVSHTIWAGVKVPLTFTEIFR